ncbi:T9SS type A sorting domain-containing protein [bacterium]|nr:T9SS type A sorting domain-containing protein [bacterium]
MFRTTLTSTLLLAATLAGGGLRAATFEPQPFLADGGVDVLDRQVTRQLVDRDLFSAPWATVVLGRVDVYATFPYLESRYFQVVSDPGWNRLVYGEMGQGLKAWDGAGTAFGPLAGPRGLAADDAGRVYVADTENDRVVVFRTVTEFDRIDLVPLYEIPGLQRPHDVAWSDGGTPFDASDDALYVANTGASEVVRFTPGTDAATETARLGGLGSGVGAFAGPLAVVAGRTADGADGTVYVADAHTGRLVTLRDTGSGLAWGGELRHDQGTVTALSCDHFGNVYATAPTGGVVKYTAGLKSVAGALPAVHRPRGFHVPQVTVTDHRDGSRRRAGEGRGVLVEQWDSGSGLRVLGLGVEIARPAQVPGRSAVDLFLTDCADLTAELVDPADGRVVTTFDLGRVAAGQARLDLAAPADGTGWEAGRYELALRAASTYDAARTAVANVSVELARAGDPDLPRNLSVLGNSPNPFNPTTTISFLMPPGVRDYEVNVYDLRGQLVRRLADGPATPGRHDVLWDGRNEDGGPVGSGVYLYRVVAGDEKASGKMILVK